MTLSAEYASSAVATVRISAFAFATFDTDADAVLAWARLIKEEDRRYDILARAWKRWRNDNRTGAEKWLEGEGELKPAEKAGIEAKLGR